MRSTINCCARSSHAERLAGSDLREFGGCADFLRRRGGRPRLIFSPAGGGGTTRIRTAVNFDPEDAATRLRSDFREIAQPRRPVGAHHADGQRPCSMPALTTACASRAGSAARTCPGPATARAMRVLSSESRLPPLASNSLTLLGFCIAPIFQGTKRDWKTVRKSLF